jgi:orotate phosphoribosyltransferase
MDQPGVSGCETMNYRSVADLNRAVQEWSAELPHDLVLVVGVPRSGLLAAMLLALHRNLPVTDLDRFLEGRVLSAGARSPEDTREASCFTETTTPFSRGTVLVVDDSAFSGREMTRVKTKIEAAGLSGASLKYGAVYITDDCKKMVDYWYEVMGHPRVFEWNIMHHPFLETSCVDIDGVLCRDPLEEENDDGARYRDFLGTVRPLIVPTLEIGWLITCRLEKYRSLTEQWLKEHKFRYKNLVMMDLPDKASRIAAGSHAVFKAEHYRKTKAILFIESSLSQAGEIVRLSGKPVYCIESREMIQPEALAQFFYKSRWLVINLRHRSRRSLKSLLLRSNIGRRVLQAYRNRVVRM